MVMLLRRPDITTQGEVFYGDILESSQIVCAAEMSPHSAKFSWSFKGQELARDGYNHEIITITEAGSLATSKLIIKKTQEGDFGKYQCTATNNLGKDVALMELRRSGSLSSGSLFLSCLLGVA